MLSQESRKDGSRNTFPRPGTQLGKKTSSAIHLHKCRAENRCAPTRALQFGHQLQKLSWASPSDLSLTNSLENLEQVVKSYHNLTKTQGQYLVVLFSSPLIRGSSVQQLLMSLPRLIPAAMCPQQCLCVSSSFTELPYQRG